MIRWPSVATTPASFWNWTNACLAHDCHIANPIRISGADAPCYVGASNYRRALWVSSRCLPPDVLATKALLSASSRAWIHGPADARRPICNWAQGPNLPAALRPGKPRCHLAGSALAIDRSGNCSLRLEYGVINRGSAASAATQIEFMIEGRTQDQRFRHSQQGRNSMAR